ncbi:hypothetical protein GGX14DRAFT_579954 [Mycena pura]|uniref:Uncharacterized protein n=1 Tax=Mycena pura TaxID=153505 RepID=A0AAD6URB0_9AGAR|nr:hypothetical protein GGX14DRAFT_579954 [Mycena pura]
MSFLLFNRHLPIAHLSAAYQGRPERREGRGGVVKESRELSTTRARRKSCGVCSSSARLPFPLLTLAARRTLQRRIRLVVQAHLIHCHLHARALKAHSAHTRSPLHRLHAFCRPRQNLPSPVPARGSPRAACACYKLPAGRASVALDSPCTPLQHALTASRRHPAPHACRLPSGARSGARIAPASNIRHPPHAPPPRAARRTRLSCAGSIHAPARHASCVGPPPSARHPTPNVHHPLPTTKNLYEVCLIPARARHAAGLHRSSHRSPPAARFLPRAPTSPTSRAVIAAARRSPPAPATRCPLRFPSPLPLPARAPQLALFRPLHSARPPSSVRCLLTHPLPVPTVCRLMYARALLKTRPRHLPPDLLPAPASSMTCARARARRPCCRRPPSTVRRTPSNALPPHAACLPLLPASCSLPTACFSPHALAGHAFVAQEMPPVAYKSFLPLPSRVPRRLPSTGRMDQLPAARARCARPSRARPAVPSPPLQLTVEGSATKDHCHEMHMRLGRVPRRPVPAVCRLPPAALACVAPARLNRRHPHATDPRTHRAAQRPLKTATRRAPPSTAPTTSRNTGARARCPPPAATRRPLPRAR